MAPAPLSTPPSCLQPGRVLAHVRASGLTITWGGRTIYTVERYRATRFWALYDPAGCLVVVAVYKKGAEAVAKLLGERRREG